MRIKNKKYLTIKNEMFLLGFLFFAIVSLVFAGIFLNLLYHNNLKSAQNSLRECNAQVVTYTEGMFRENAAIIDILSRDITVIHAGDGNNSAVIAIFNAIQKRNSNITYIYSGYANGSLLINQYATPIHYNATERPWYQAAAATSDVARLVYSDAATGVWLFSQSKQMVDEKGNMIGAVCIDCSNESITQQLRTKYQYDSQRSFIVNAKGTVLIHPVESDINTSIREKMEAGTWRSIVNGNSNYAEYDLNGVRTMAYFERIPKTNFIVVTAINASEVIQPIVKSTLFLFILIVTISILLGMILSRLLICRFARPIMKLGERIQTLADGKSDLCDVQELTFTNEEIAHIAQSIEVIVKNIANREKQREAAEFLSIHDSMTGLYNRRFFENQLQSRFLRKQESVCFICCDVNGLKLINDIFGHAAGDQLIRTVSGCLEKGCRKEDSLARIGGDEFAVILPNTSAATAQRIIAQIKMYFPDNGICHGRVSASLGYAVQTQKEQKLDEIFQAADEMMYEQKLKESADMKRCIVTDIIEHAQNEGIICNVTKQERAILSMFASTLAPESESLLTDSYYLRQMGLCPLVSSLGGDPESSRRRHTEISYRILSTLDEYRGIAGCILHYQEHFDGSGWPAGLAGRDIPLLSRIMAVTEAYFSEQESDLLQKRSGTWYDPNLVALLQKYKHNDIDENKETGQ